MEINLDYLDLPTLEAFYTQEEERLKAYLLAGRSWQSLAEERQLVTKLAMTIHQRRFPSQSFNLVDFKYNKDEPTGVRELS